MYELFALVQSKRSLYHQHVLIYAILFFVHNAAIVVQRDLIIVAFERVPGIFMMNDE